MSNFRIAYNNFGAASGVTVSASSELVSFPASNAFHQFRSKKWTPSGSFRITASNNKLYINDGSDKTITLTNAVYTTGTLLAAHIQTQLNASSTLWTCTYSTTTGIFTLGRTGTKVLKLTTTTNAVWNTIGFLGVADQDASAGDIRRNHTSERLAVDLGVSREVQFFAAYQSPDSEFCLSDTAVCTLRANSVDDYDSAPYSVTVTVGTDGIYYFTDSEVDTEYRYWFFDFIDRENTDGPEGFSIKLWLGDYVSPEKNFVNGFSARTIDPSIVRTSENGIKYANRKTKYTQISSLGIEWLVGADRIIMKDLFDYCGTTKPFFIIVDPTALISSENELTKLVTFDSDPDMNHIRYTYYSFNLSLSEVVG